MLQNHIYQHPVAVASYCHNLDQRYQTNTLNHIKLLVGHTKLMMIFIAAKELGVNPVCLNEIIGYMTDEEFSVSSLKAEYKEAMRQQKQDMGV